MRVIADLIAIPDFGPGAMENWGLITYRMSTLLYKPTVSTDADKESVAVVIAHELAHQVQQGPDLRTHTYLCLSLIVSCSLWTSVLFCITFPGEKRTKVLHMCSAIAIQEQPVWNWGQARSQKQAKRFLDQSNTDLFLHHGNALFLISFILVLRHVLFFAVTIASWVSSCCAQLSAFFCNATSVFLHPALLCQINFLIVSVWSLHCRLDSHSRLQFRGHGELGSHNVQKSVSAVRRAFVHRTGQDGGRHCYCPWVSTSGTHRRSKLYSLWTAFCALI